MVENHYHVCTGPQGGSPVSDIQFETYEDSLLCFMGLANTMFRELRGDDYDLTLEQALDATAHGDSRGAYVGPSSLLVYWLRCAGEEHEHEIPSWN